jgi:hypothetical protein
VIVGNEIEIIDVESVRIYVEEVLKVERRKV